MTNMFCFQCEQTAGGMGCRGKAGVCGKKEDTAQLQDQLTGTLIGLAQAAGGKSVSREGDLLLMEGLFSTLTNVNFDNQSILHKIEAVHTLKDNLIKQSGLQAGDALDYDVTNIWQAENDDIRSLKSLLLFGLRGIAAYAYHALILGYEDKEVNDFLYKGLYSLNKDYGMDELLPLVMEAGKVNLQCMALLDRANTETYGTPVPTTVPLTVAKGPFIIITGHDLEDLYLLLEQTKDKGINIYTHGEMLPAHAYPKLKAYPHLKGNFGTAWQNQQKEFASVPAPILFTTNCIMPVKESYSDRVFTTGVVDYPGMIHIGQDKNFAPVIAKALELGGYDEDQHMTGINGGNQVTTGFAHGTVLSVAPQVIEAVKAGAIKHFFLVGGCDGARGSRSYYTEFVQKAPQDSVILTLACGKYRFNDLDLGQIGGLPRLMDMGQCNDAYSAIRVAVALSEAFGCGVNDLPLTLVLSWYEQKAVSILLSLLYLGIKNIYIGPTLPAFISPGVLDFLVKEFALTPISTPEEDLKKILA